MLQMIKVKNLVKEYGDFTALDKVSFQAKQGEIVGLLGQNGAGKTTLMRILTGYLRPTAGKVTIADFDIVKRSLAARQHIGYLPETVPLYSDMTVRGYLDYIAALRQIPKHRQRVNEVLALVDLKTRGKQLIRQLSKGMRQRVGLAQVLVHEPPVLILDEPTIGLDPQQVSDIRALIQQLGKKHTILLSTHILSEAEQLCDRILIIHQGKLIAEGQPQDLRSQLNISSQIFLRVNMITSDLLSELEPIDGVEAVSYQSDSFLITISGDYDDICPQIAEIVFEHDLELLELRPINTTLEDIFMAYTVSQ